MTSRKTSKKILCAIVCAGLVSSTVLPVYAGKFNFAPVHAGMEAPELNKESDKEFNVDTVSTSFEMPELLKAYDKKLDLAPVHTEYEIPDLDIELFKLDLNPVTTEFSLKLKEAFGGIHLDPVSTSFDLDLGEVSFDSDTLFDYDSAVLKEEGKKALDIMFPDYAAMLTDEEHIGSLAYIDFAGHTDSDGDYDYNLQLSLDRAFAVYDYCLTNCCDDLTVKQYQALEKAAHVNGYAFTQPVLNADGSENKTASRRVTLRYYFDNSKITE